MDVSKIYLPTSCVCCPRWQWSYFRKPLPFASRSHVMGQGKTLAALSHGMTLFPLTFIPQSLSMRSSKAEKIMSQEFHFASRPLLTAVMSRESGVIYICHVLHHVQCLEDWSWMSINSLPRFPASSVKSMISRWPIQPHYLFKKHYPSIFWWLQLAIQEEKSLQYRILFCLLLSLHPRTRLWISPTRSVWLRSPLGHWYAKCQAWPFLCQTQFSFHVCCHLFWFF